MREKYSTKEMIAYLDDTVDGATAGSVDLAIIDRLRAADKLHDAVLEQYRWHVSPGITPYDIMSYQLRDAMRKYEGKEKR